METRLGTAAGADASRDHDHGSGVEGGHLGIAEGDEGGRGIGGDGTTRRAIQRLLHSRKGHKLVVLDRGCPHRTREHVLFAGEPHSSRRAHLLCVGDGEVVKSFYEL